jgi:hypothetical protein
VGKNPTGRKTTPDLSGQECSFKINGFKFGDVVFYVYILTTKKVIMATTKKTTKTKPVSKPAPKTPTKGTPKKSGKKASLTVKTTATIYEPVSHHIYYDGNSYRVRAVRNGVKFSQCFSSKKKAFEFRKSVLSA